MPITPVAKPVNPNVPVAPGVPALNRINTIANTIALVVADAALLVQAFGPRKWGIFSPAGVPLIMGDSVVAVDFRREGRVVDYQVEAVPNSAALFASYNKTLDPSDVRVSFASSGKGSFLDQLIGPALSLFTGDQQAVRRGAFLATLDDAIASLDPLVVVTPEKSYASCNLIHYDYRRDARNGARLLVIDCWLREVRVAAPPQYTSVKTPSAAAPIAQGATQPSTPTPPQAKAFTQPAVST